MLGVDVARQLKDAGLAWKPAPGDRFTIPDRDLDDETFVLSHMTIEVHTLPEGRMIGFNGTTEWALDDVGIDEAIWLPSEAQLRELLGGTFHALRRTRWEPAVFEVDTATLGEARTFTAATAADAYAAALLQLLKSL